MNITSSISSLDINETTSHRHMRLYCGDHGHMKTVVLKCSDRTCQYCRKRIYYKLFKSWFKLAEGMNNPKLLTLTTINVQHLTKEHLKMLRKWFVRLMRRKYYKDRITGGLYVIELKNIGNGWNIHLHALIDTIAGYDGFLTQKKISDDWLKITGTSKIVDIRQARNPRMSLKYILKYLTKSPEINGETELYNQVLKGSRLIQTFGSLYSCKPEKGEMKCEKCGCINWVSEYELNGHFSNLEKKGFNQYRKRFKDYTSAVFEI